MRDARIEVAFIIAVGLILSIALAPIMPFVLAATVFAVRHRIKMGRLRDRAVAKRALQARHR